MASDWARLGYSNAAETCADLVGGGVRLGPVQGSCRDVNPVQAGIGRLYEYS